MQLFNFVILQLFIINSIFQRPLFSLDVKLTKPQLKGICHFSFKLPEFLRRVNLNIDLNLVWIQNNLDYFHFFLVEFAHILFLYVLTIKSSNKSFYES